MFSENLKKIKTKWGLTHEDLAKLLDDPKINKDTISNLSRDNTTPSPQLLAKLELLTGITMYDLFSMPIGFDDIPASPLSTEKVKDGAEATSYKREQWPTMGLREFFSRNEQLFEEIKRLSERVAALEKKSTQ